MRAADAAEKITAVHPEYLRPYKHHLINRVAQIDQQEVRWHVAQMLPRLQWTVGQRKRVVQILMTYLADKSRIVKTCAMQSLVDLAQHDQESTAAVMPLLRKLTATGTPAMQARGRKLMRELNRRRDSVTYLGQEGFEHSRSIGNYH